ncbi:MAG TPA: hypothetical protein VF604_13585, partial [Pyrinomonadaceae bacterium]
VRQLRESFPIRFHKLKQRARVNLKNRLASFQANLISELYATENCYSMRDHPKPFKNNDGS